MSGLRPEAMRRFYARLHDRGEDAGKYAPELTRISKIILHQMKATA